MQVGYTFALYVSICTQPKSAVTLPAAKSRKIFLDTIMTEQAPCFQLGFDLLNVQNSDDFEESSGEVACSFNKLWSPLIKSRINLRKPRKRRISECFTVCYFTVILLM